VPRLQAPLDGRVPYLVIPRTDVPEEHRAFFARPGDYARRLFAAAVGRWGAGSRFPVGHLKGSLGEAGEIASETQVRRIRACVAYARASPHRLS
jgi:exoribonuclease R